MSFYHFLFCFLITTYYEDVHQNSFFSGDLWPESDREGGKEEPDYIKTEREQFSSFRDTNKDGKMDKVCIVEIFIRK